MGSGLAGLPSGMGSISPGRRRRASDPDTPATQITESGVYIIDSGQNAGTFKISDSDITTNVFIGHGVTMLAKRWIYMYIKAGQYIRASDEGFLAIPLSPA